MKIWLIFFTVFALAGCTSAPIADSDQPVDSIPKPGAPVSGADELEAPAPINRTTTVIFSECEGAAPKVSAPPGLMPWEGSGNWSPNPAPIFEATFTVYSCKSVDVFGLLTVNDVRIALQAHDQVGDRNGAFDHIPRSGIWELLGIHVSNRTVAEAIRSQGWTAEIGDITVDGTTGRLALKTTTGTVEADVRAYRDGDVGALDALQFITVASFYPLKWGVLTMELQSDATPVHATVHAEAGTRLGEWNVLSGPAPAPAVSSYYVQSKLILEFGD